MIIDELTHDDIMQVIEHLHDYCSCREECTNCTYSDKFLSCNLRNIPQEWRPEAIMKGGDDDDQV